MEETGKSSPFSVYVCLKIKYLNNDTTDNSSPT